MIHIFFGCLTKSPGILKPELSKFAKDPESRILRIRFRSRSNLSIVEEQTD